MKKIAALLTAALTASAVATAADAGSTRHATLDLALDSTHATRTFVDAQQLRTKRAPNDSRGDTVVLHAPLVNASGGQMGEIDATFLTTAPGASAKHDGSEQLTGTLTLADGSELAIQGIVGAFATTTHVAVVGGTGRYLGARGEVTARFTPRTVKLHIELA